MYLWSMLLKPNWNPRGTKRCEKASQIEQKVDKKGTLKREWTLFCEKMPTCSSTHYLLYIQQVDRVRQPLFFNNLCTSNYTKSYEKHAHPKNP